MTDNMTSNSRRSRGSAEQESAVQSYINRLRNLRGQIVGASRLYDKSMRGEYRSGLSRWLSDVQRLGNQVRVVMAGICTLLRTNSAAHPGCQYALAAVQQLSLYKDPPTHIANLVPEAIDDLKTAESLLEQLIPPKAI